MPLARSGCRGRVDAGFLPPPVNSGQEIQVVAQGVDDHAGRRPRAGFLHDGCPVPFDSARAGKQRFTDLFVVFLLADQADDLFFPFGKNGRRRLLPAVVAAAGDDGCQPGRGGAAVVVVAAVDRTYCLKYVLPPRAFLHIPPRPRRDHVEYEAVGVKIRQRNAGAGELQGGDFPDGFYPAQPRHLQVC